MRSNVQFILETPLIYYVVIPKRLKGLAWKASRRRKPCRGSNPFYYATTVKMNKMEHTVLQNRLGVIVSQGDLTEYMLDVWFAKPKLQICVMCQTARRETANLF